MEEPKDPEFFRNKFLKDKISMQHVSEPETPTILKFRRGRTKEKQYNPDTEVPGTNWTKAGIFVK